MLPNFTKITPYNVNFDKISNIRFICDLVGWAIFDFDKI